MVGASVEDATGIKLVVLTGLTPFDIFDFVKDL